MVTYCKSPAHNSENWLRKKVDSFVFLYELYFKVLKSRQKSDKKHK